MIDNVGEWTTDWHSPAHEGEAVKGGAHLCAPVDTSTCHVGFRCIVRVPAATA